MQTPILYMAPLRGVTDYLFRTIFTDHFGGFDAAVAPFISSKRDRVFKPKYILDVLPENNPKLPIIPQILSKSAEEFIALADYLYEFGYDTVNWNLGCPFPTVAKKKRGAGMLPYTEEIDAFLDHACRRLKGRLSIKLRLGWHDSDDIFRLIPVLNTYPVEELIIHPRTGIQRYEGHVDLDAFEQCLPLTELPVVYNGDIRSLEDYRKLSTRFPTITRWMIGRGCVSNPFLPMNIASPQNPASDKIKKIKSFHCALFEAYSSILSGPSHVMNKMKGFWQYFSAFFQDCGKEIKKIKKARGPEEYLSQVNLFFNSTARLVNSPPNHPKKKEIF